MNKVTGKRWIYIMLLLAAALAFSLAGASLSYAESAQQEPTQVTMDAAELKVYEDYCAGSKSNFTYAYAILYQMVQRMDGQTSEEYARTYQLLLDHFGVPNKLVHAAAGEEVWNLVQMDDGKYYWVDPAGCDEDLRYDYGTYGIGDEYAAEPIEKADNVSDSPRRMNYAGFLRGASFGREHAGQGELPEVPEKDYVPEISGIQAPAESKRLRDYWGTSADWVHDETDPFFYLVVQNDGLHRQVEVRSRQIDTTKELVIPAEVTIDGLSYDVAGVDLGCVDQYKETITIAEGVRYVFGLISYEPAAAKTMMIPSTVEWIETPYLSMVCLEDIRVSGDNPYISSEDGALYSKDRTTLIRYPVAKQDEAFTVPPSVNNIYHDAFAWNRYLKSVAINKTVKYINAYSFRQTYSLEELTVPSSVALLPQYVFLDNTSLKTIHIDDRTSFSGDTFSGCGAQLDIGEDNASGSIYDGALYIGDRLYSWPAGRSAETVQVMDGCSRIMPGAFRGSGRIGTVVIPSDCEISGDAFTASGVEHLQIGSGNTSVRYEDGMLLSPDGTQLWTVLKGYTREEFEVPDSVRIICDGAFEGNETLRKITAGDQVTSIGGAAFRNCSALKEIILPEGIKEISNGMFEGCKALDHLVLPESAEVIGDTALWTGGAIGQLVVKSRVLQPLEKKNIDGSTTRDWTRSLPVAAGAWSVQPDDDFRPNDGDITYVYAHADSQIAKYLTDPSRLSRGESESYTVVFRDIEQTAQEQPDQGSCGEQARWQVSEDGKTLTVSGSGRIDNYVLNNTVEAPWMWKYGDRIENVIIEEGITGVGEFAFYGMKKLKSVSLPQSLRRVDRWAFAGCTALRSVEFKDYVSMMENYAFAYDTGLVSVSLPEGAGEIRGSFMGCSALQDVEFGGPVRLIRDCAFGGCSALQKLDLSQVMYLGNQICPLCPRLTKLWLSEILEIESYSMKDVTAKLYYTAKVPEEVVGKNYGGSLQWIPSGTDPEEPEPEEPSDPTDPTEPTEPSDPTDPTDPITDPTEPSEPTDPTKPEKPEKPATDPTEPTDDPGNSSESAADPGNDLPGTGIATAAKKQTITVSDSFTRPIGTSFRLDARAMTKLIYSSSNAQVATVTQDGKVTVRGYGSCTITVTAAATSQYRETVRRIIIKGRLARPVLKVVNKRGGKVKLSWNKVAGTRGYLLYVKLPGQKKYRLAIGKSAKVKSVTHRGLLKGKKYSYKLRAYVKTGKKIVYSRYSKPVTVKVKK